MIFKKSFNSRAIFATISFPILRNKFFIDRQFKICIDRQFKINYNFSNSVFLLHTVSGRFTNGSTRDLKQYIRFSTVVRRVEYNGDTDDFKVITKNLKEDKEVIERFTHVVVATGLFTLPNVPDITGIEGFRGRVLHAKNVRHLDEFKGKKVLVVGSFISADDLSTMLIKFGAENVVISYKYRPHGFKWPKGVEERPLVKEFKANTAYFKDGTTAEFDVVLFCTGYKLEFPFMSEELRLKTDNLFYPENLYKGVLWMNGGNDKLIYIGMIYNVFHFITYEAQAIWACRKIMGSIQLPSRDEMLSDIDQWTRKAKNATKNHDFAETLEFIKDYFRHFVESVGYNSDVLGLPDCISKLLEHRSEDICTWRDKQFKCIYTGSMSPALKSPWMVNFDSELETFIKQY